MRALVQKINAHPFSAKAYEWGKLISITGGAQVIVQLTGLISGIIIIRMLPTQEYALYTLANTMLGTLTVLADGGISAGVMAQGGKVWQDREKLGTVLVTGLALRKKFAIGSLLIATPVLVYLLLHHGASLLTSLLLILSLVPAFYAALSDTLMEVAPKLRQDIVPLQQNQIAANIARLFLIGLTVFVFPWAFVAVLGGGLPRIWANIRLQKISAKYANYEQPASVVVRNEILVFVRRILPGAVYYCISGQITVWLISMFGSTSSLAQLGALGRLAMLLSLFGVLFSTLIAPRFSRLPPNRKLLLKRFVQLQAAMIGVSLLVVLTAATFPAQVLWILGNDYSQLNRELVLNLAASCVSLMAGMQFGLFTGRGWAINPALSIPISIGSIIVGILLFSPATLQGVLRFNLFLALVQFLMNCVYCICKIFQVKSEH